MNVLEIRDPHLNSDEILKLIAELIKNKTVPDFSAIGPEILRNMPADIPQKPDIKSGNHETYIDLMLAHQLEEPEFSSEMPIIGTWIVQLRQLWNWMSTKWYVRPIIRQQSTINGQIAFLLLEMEAWMNEKNRTIVDLEARVNQLESILSVNSLHEK